jgi:hypothetical protein
MFFKKKINGAITTMQTTLFFEPQKGFDLLNDADKKAAHRIGAENAGATLVQDPFPSAALTDYLYTNFRNYITDDQSKAFIAKALKNYTTSPDVIDVIFKHSPRPNGKNGLFTACFTTIAADQNLHHLWPRFEDFLDKTYPNDKNMPVTIACDYKLFDIAKSTLLNAAHGESDAFYTALSAVNTADTARFKDILSLSDRFTRDLKSLNELFIQAADRNLVDNAKALLLEGANINANNGAALYYAAKNDNADFFNELIQHINLEKHGSQILESIKSLPDYSPTLIKPLQVIVDKINLEAALLKADKARYSVPRADILSDTLQLASGITLTTLFNFESREKIIITENKTALDTVVISFNDLDNFAIEDALKKLQDRGGTAVNDWMHKTGARKATLNKD